jgi:hypothetical protein
VSHIDPTFEKKDVEIIVHRIDLLLVNDSKGITIVMERFAIPFFGIKDYDLHLLTKKVHKCETRNEHAVSAGRSNKSK